MVECDKCKVMLIQRETTNKVLKDIGLESGGQVIRIEVLLCEKCYDNNFEHLRGGK